MYRRGLARLPGDDCLSISANIQRQDIIAVELFIITILLGFHRHLLATIIRLLASCRVKDNAKRSCHPNDFAIRRIPTILVALRCLVAMDKLDLILSLGLLRIDSQVFRDQSLLSVLDFQKSRRLG